MYYSILIAYAEQTTKGKSTAKPVVRIDDENLDYISEKIIKPYLSGFWKKWGFPLSFCMNKQIKVKL